MYIMMEAIFFSFLFYFWKNDESNLMECNISGKSKSKQHNG